MRILLVVACACLLVGSGIGFGVGSRVTPRPLQPAVGVTRYAEGLQLLDGEELWSGMSPYLQGKIVKSGDTHASFVDFYAQLRSKPGSHIDQVQYVGGYQTKEKGIFVYVTRHVEPGKEPTEIIWMFVTDPDGLIDYIF